MAAGAVPTTWSAPGAPWFRAVRAAVGELQDGDALREVVIVVPPGPAATALRRALPRAAEAGRGLAGATVTTAVDLAHRLARPLLDERVPATRPVRLAAARQALAARTWSPALARVREHPATLEAVAELAEALGPLALADPAEAGAARHQLAGGRAVAAELVAAAEATRRVLLDAGYRDEALLLATAAGRLDRLGAPVVVALADELPPVQVRFLASVLGAAGAAARLVVPHVADDDHLVAVVSALGGTEPEAPPAPVPTPLVRNCSDPDEECRHAVRHVVGLVESGVRPDRIAVVHPPGAVHGRAVREELTRANVPWQGRAPGTLAGSLAGQVLGVLVAALEPGGDGLGRSCVFGLLAVAPRTPTFVAGRPDAVTRPVARWESLARRLGIVAEGDWELAADRLARRHAAERDHLLGDDRAEDGDQRAASVARRHEAEVRQLDRLLRFVGALRRDLAAVQRAGSWTAAATALRGAWHRQVGTDPWRRTYWERQPVAQRRAAERVRASFDALEELDRLGEPYDVAALVRLVRAGLDAPIGAATDTPTGVVVASLGDGGVLDVDHVLIVGANDGVLPPRRAEGLLVPTGPLFPGPEVTVRRAWRAWQLLRGGVPDVLVTWARSDLRAGGRRFRSPWLAVDGEAVASHAAGVLGEGGASAWLTPSERVARRAGAGPAAVVAALATTVHGHRRVGALVGRSVPAAGAYDGIVGAGAVEAPARGVAPTWLEAYATCPFGHFVRHVLGVRHEEDPIEIDDPPPRVRGILAHQVLAELVAEWLATPPGERGTWLGDDAAVAAARARAAELLDAAAEAPRAAGLLGHGAVWAIRRRQLLDVVGRALAEERDLQLEPLGAEVAFGDGRPGSLPGLALALDDGPVLLRGAIDRVDRRRDGSLVVTDVKSGRRDRYVLPEGDSTAGGTRLQLAVYGLVARQALGGGTAPVLTRYRFVGRLDVQRPVELALTDEVEGALHDAVARALAGITAGRFPPAAPSPSFPAGWDCPYCVPDGLGGDELAERVRAGQPPP